MVRLYFPRGTWLIWPQWEKKGPSLSFGQNTLFYLCYQLPSWRSRFSIHVFVCSVPDQQLLMTHMHSNHLINLGIQSADRRSGEEIIPGEDCHHTPRPDNLQSFPCLVILELCEHFTQRNLWKSWYNYLNTHTQCCCSVSYICCMLMPCCIGPPLVRTLVRMWLGAIRYPSVVLYWMTCIVVKCLGKCVMQQRIGLYLKDPSFVNINHNRLVNRLLKTSRLFLDCAAAVNFDASQKNSVEYLQLLLYYIFSTFLYIYI